MKIRNSMTIGKIISLLFFFVQEFGLAKQKGKIGMKIIYGCPSGD
jgi:hypothetical protein